MRPERVRSSLPPDCRAAVVRWRLLWHDCQSDKQPDQQLVRPDLRVVALFQQRYALQRASRESGTYLVVDLSLEPRHFRAFHNRLPTTAGKYPPR
jgi:hypothetical protein